MAGNINDCLAHTNCIGMVENVDTRKVVVAVENEGVLNTLKINDIVVLGGSNSDEKLIGILTKVTKKRVEFDETEQTEDLLYSNNCCVVNLVGSFYNKYGAGSENKFKRAINTYPEINSKVYQANEAAMQMIMNAVSGKAAESRSLEIGHFASNKDVAAILDGNRFFNDMHVLLAVQEVENPIQLPVYWKKPINYHMPIWSFSICMGSIMSYLMQIRSRFVMNQVVYTFHYGFSIMRKFIHCL